LNCWQFCMLNYIEEGLLNLSDVGKLYEFREKNEITIADALHYGKAAYALSLEELDKTFKIASKGDLLSFSSEINKIYHSTLFLDYNSETQEVSYMDMLNCPARTIKINIGKLNKMIILTKSSDVQPNVQKFLESNYK